MHSTADLPALHGAEFRRCLLELDVDGIRKLWARVAPHLSQPETAEAALHTMHLARASMRTLPLRARRYSEAWLAERERKSAVAAAVGISIGRHGAQTARHLDLQAELGESVLGMVREGVDLDREAPEVKRRIDWRINRARTRTFGGRKP